MCPRCEGRGSVTGFHLSQLYDDSKSVNEGALMIPGYSVDQDQGRQHQPDVRGSDPENPEVVFVQGQQTLDSSVEIGLGYLGLDRSSGTLSGGEAQRTKMVRHLGSSLTDVTHVFDEPTTGLHPHDIQRMNDLLLKLRDKGSTVLIVEHKPEAIAIAEHVIDLGPGAGTEGGEVVFEGTVEGLQASDTLTGRHLDDRASLQPSVPLIHGSITSRPPREGVVSVDHAAIKGSRRSNPPGVIYTDTPIWG